MGRNVINPTNQSLNMNNLTKLRIKIIKRRKRMIQVIKRLKFQITITLLYLTEAYLLKVKPKAVQKM